MTGTAVELLSFCWSRNVVLTPIGHRLKVDAPEAELTPDLVNRLRLNKTELLTLLQPGKPEEVTAPLTLWPAEKGEPDDSASIEWPAALVDFVLLLTPEDLPPEPFQLNAWTTVIDRTKFLRSVQTDLRAGHTGPRARLGAVQADLRHLQSLLASHHEFVDVLDY